MLEGILDYLGFREDFSSRSAVVFSSIVVSDGAKFKGQSESQLGVQR